jgi:tRNA (mo5U34)-methyltransferase
MSVIAQDNDDHDWLRDVIEQSANRYRADLMKSGWWHSIDLGNGQITNGVNRLEDLQTSYARFELPPDLAGKRVLDVGCWDGFYAFEAERHGAEVVAIDCFRPDTFFFAREALRSQVEFQEMSVYELSSESIGLFDVVFFLGVLYHLQHPLLGMQRVCEVTKEVALIGSHVIDNLLDTQLPVMEFYPFDELGGQYDNWWGPNSKCLAWLAKTAGFVRVEFLYNDLTSAVIKAWRHWQHPPLAASPSLIVRNVANTVFLDRRLVRRGRFALLSIWIQGLPDDAIREDVRVEVGGYGSAPVYVEPPIKDWAGDNVRVNRLTPARLDIEPAIREVAQEFVQVITPVPPGLETGKTTLRVYYQDKWSNDFEITLSDNSPW